MSGFVSLVGAGPGDPGLLTVRGRKAILEAAVVLYDHLASPALLSAVDVPGQERIHVGKAAGLAFASQEAITALVIRRALAGQRVVRLKGGDPFIFGRGTEEIEALHSAGVAWRVIPGVSSINGVSGAAGITLTKRGRNHGFAVLSAATTPAEEIRRWAKIEGPLAIFMGIHKAAIISHEFIAGGRAENEPVVVIARGGTDTERVAETTLAELPELLAQPEDWTPGLIIVGATREAAFKARSVAAPATVGEHVFTRSVS